MKSQHGHAKIRNYKRAIMKEVITINLCIITMTMAIATLLYIAGLVLGIVFSIENLVKGSLILLIPVLQIITVCIIIVNNEKSIRKFFGW